MKKSQIIKSILKYEDKRGMTNDDITYTDILNEIVELYPDAVKDPEILLGWINASSAYHEEVMNQYKEEFINYLKDETFAKKYIQRAIVHKNCMEVLELHPKFLKTQWFAKIAVNKFFPDDFVKLNCSKWLKDKAFLEKNKLEFNFSRRMNLFTEILTEEDYLRTINYNAHVATDVPKNYVNKEFLIKVMSLPKGDEVIKSLYRNLPYELQADRDILNFATTFEDGRCLTSINTKKLDKETYVIIVENLKGSDTLFHFGEMLCEIWDKSWFDESIIYKTLSEFSTIYKNHGDIRGDGMGGAIYSTHPIKDALTKMKDKSPSLNTLFNSDASSKYFERITNEKELKQFEKNLSTIMQDYEPCYRQVMLNNQLNGITKKSSIQKI